MVHGIFNVATGKKSSGLLVWVLVGPWRFLVRSYGSYRDVAPLGCGHCFVFVVLGMLVRFLMAAGGP